MTVVSIRAPMAWLGPGRLVEDAAVVVDGGRVAFAGPASDLGVVVYGARGAESAGGGPAPPEPDEELHVDGFLMPGVVDRHVHVGLSDPGAVIAGGVTAVRDLGWPAEDIFPLAEASEWPSFNGPLVRAAGPMITAVRGYPTRAGWAPEGTAVEVRGGEEAAAAARRLLARGAAVLKIALNADAGPVLADEEILAVCEVAHEAGTVVAAHVQGPGQAARAIGAGVDEFAHCPWSERLSEEMVAAAARRMRMVSTLDIHSYGRDTPALRTATDNLRRFVVAGGRVAYGTDLGNGPIRAGIHVGEAWHLLGAGLTAHRVLETLTFRPLASGEPADVVAVDGNPLEDLAALGRPMLVLRGGQRFL